jgi:hypothetical protein
MMGNRLFGVLSCRVVWVSFARGVPRAVTVAFRFMTRRVTVVCEPVSVVCAVCLCPRGRGRGEAGAPGYMCNYRNVFRRRAHAPRPRARKPENRASAVAAAWSAASATVRHAPLRVNYAPRPSDSRHGAGRHT